jgi:hypothetical protein
LAFCLQISCSFVKFLLMWLLLGREMEFATHSKRGFVLSEY